MYFNTADWDVNVDGLIYTDSEFLHELNAFLVEQGLCAVTYSEQGMQDDERVSCDAYAFADYVRNTLNVTA